MTTTDALVRCLEPIEGATVSIEGKVVPNWSFLNDDVALARLSDGERSLVWFGLQLFNGGTITDPPDLHRALTHLDAENTVRVIEAIGAASGLVVQVGVPVRPAERVAEHRGDAAYLERAR